MREKQGVEKTVNPSELRAGWISFQPSLIGPRTARRGEPEEKYQPWISHESSIGSRTSRRGESEEKYQPWVSHVPATNKGELVAMYRPWISHESSIGPRTARRGEPEGKYQPWVSHVPATNKGELVAMYQPWISHESSIGPRTARRGESEEKYQPWNRSLELPKREYWPIEKKEMSCEERPSTSIVRNRSHKKGGREERLRDGENSQHIQERTCTNWTVVQQFVPTNPMQLIDSKREEFRKYLERAGVMEALTKVLVGLYEEAEKPTNALEYPL
uniref:Uncharacterized protein n=1 Tax=Timema poppense TaxID=170557 RepID=A0A7R9D5N8_TIMPO|nr:unnamed protein product [Timema poppensis]